MAIFIIAFLAIYAAANTYIFIRGWQALEISPAMRIAYATLFWLWATLAITTQIMRLRGASGELFSVLTAVGAMWLAVMLYAFIAAAVTDIIRLGGWITGVRPSALMGNYPLAKAAAMAAVCAAITAVCAWGWHNARHPRVERLAIGVGKDVPGRESLRVVLLSDLHLGHVTGRRFMARVVDMVNAQKPDIVLIAGDTFDGGPEPVFHDDMCAEMLRIESPLGVWASTGNHEYIGLMEDGQAIEKGAAYLASRGVGVLQDSMVVVGGGICIAGRKDREDIRRKSVREVVAGADPAMPLILLDHQPYDLDKAVEAGVDLQLSGHTHRGQMWPLGSVTRRIFEVDHGYLKKSGSHFYVSPGTGTWGPAVRTSGKSEITVIDITFGKNG